MADNSKKKESTTLVNFRVDANVKESAEAVLAGMGLNMSSYIGMALRQVAQERKIPFTPNVDAGFWVAEAAASDAMRAVESGMLDLEREMALALWKAYASEITKMGNEGLFKKTGLNEEIAIGVRFARISSHFFAAVETIEKLAKNDADLEACGRLRASLADAARHVLEGWDGDAELPDDPEEAVEALSEATNSALRAYENHRENLEMRFAQQGADSDAFATIAGLSEQMAEREEKMEKEQDEKRRNNEELAMLMLALSQAKGD